MNRHYQALLLLLAVMAAMLTACSEDELSSTSIITADKVQYTPFDRWLEANYVNPYNIAFKYRYEDKESDMNYYTIPANYDDAVILAHLVKYLCIEAYDEAGGIAFTRANFPKLIFTIGEWEYRNNGTFILGTAEGGKKILLSGVNYVSNYVNSPDMLNYYYLKTIHHEFTHILNQTKDYSESYQLITGAGYVADYWSEAPYNTDYLGRGFISAYAQHSDTEDFAEMLSIYVTNSAQQWDEWLAEAGQSGESLLKAKLDIVREYMQKAWDIDIDVLRSAVQRRQDDVARNRIDLTDLSVD